MENELWNLAEEAAHNSYSPYSHFRVGAALLTQKGEVFTGTNVENRSFGLTICAERTAITQAVTKGHTKFKALYLVCPDAETPVPPCGACRQVISEFTDENFPVYFRDGKGKIHKTTTGELYPLDSLKNLKEPH